MTTLLRVSDSAEFLGIVPSLAGFTPRQSIVLLPFLKGRAYGAMRIDLPDDGADPADYARAAIGLVTKVKGADAVAVVVYCDDDPTPTRDGLVLPFAVQIEQLRAYAERAELRIVDALCVTPGGWSSYLDDDPELAPLAAPPAALGMDEVSGDQHEGTGLPPADLAEKERVARAVLDLSAILDRENAPTGRENPQVIAALTMLDDIPEFFETLLDAPETQPVFATAALLWCLNRPIIRDVALTQWATDLQGGSRTLTAQLAFANSRRPIADDLGDVFLGRGAAPNPDRLRLALSAVRVAAARAPRSLRPGPLTVAAWLSWALGRATHATHYLDLVRSIDPQYGLADLLGAMIHSGILPEWVFRRGAGVTT